MQETLQDIAVEVVNELATVVFEGKVAEEVFGPDRSLVKGVGTVEDEL